MGITEYTDQTFYELTGQRKNTFSILRLFNILLDDDRVTKFQNIFRSYILSEDDSIDASFYTTYEVGNDEYWDNISYNLYETPYLWWVVAIINNISNPFEYLESGTILKVLRREYIYQIVKDLERISGT